MEIDFSQINLQYLIHARDLAKEDPERAAVLLGIESTFAGMLAEVTPAELMHITRIKVPLLRPYEQVWWSRFLQAIKDGQPGEIDALLEHANLIAINGN